MKYKIKILLILFVLYSGVCFSQAPEVELLCPPSVDILVSSSIKYIDSVFIPNNTISGWHSDPLDGEWILDTCYYISTPSITSCCTFSVRINIDSELGLEIPVTDLPVDLEWECSGADTPAVIAGWEQSPLVFGLWNGRMCPPCCIWVHPDSSGRILTVGSDSDSTFSPKAILNEISATSYELILPTVNCTLWTYATYLGTSYVFYETGYLWDTHLEELVLAPVCNRLGECTDWFYWNFCWYPHMTGPGLSTEALDSFYHGASDATVSYHSLFPRVICNYHFPAGSLSSISDSIYTNICSGGCGDSTIYDNRFHFMTDSTSAWMTIEWATGADTIHYGDAGTFWFQPEDMSIPWRRFGVLTDNTDLPSGYTGDVTVCLQDVTNAPVVRYGDPVHLHPRGVDPFMPLTVGTTTYDRCVPSPPEPVCWSFNIGGDAIPETEEPRAETGTLSLDVSGEGTSSLSIEYSCTGEGVIAVYDILGRAIFRQHISGDGVINWGEKNNSTGIYFAVLNAGEKSVKQKLLLVK